MTTSDPKGTANVLLRSVTIQRDRLLKEAEKQEVMSQLYRARMESHYDKMCRCREEVTHLDQIEDKIREEFRLDKRNDNADSGETCPPVDEYSTTLFKYPKRDKPY